MSQLVDQLAKLAAQAEPPALDDTAARRLVNAAVMRAALADARPEPRRRAAWPFALALAAAAVVAIVVMRPRASAPEPALMHVALPTGDKLSGTAGARFDIDELSPGSRKLRLHAGTMVFDVAHVVANQHFEVATRDAVIVATGTVFSVGTDDRGTHVHVYEGSVEIRRASQTLSLAAGADWQTAPLADSPQIVDVGTTAAREREHIAVAPAPLPDPGVTQKHENTKPDSGATPPETSRFRDFASLSKSTAPASASSRASERAAAPPAVEAEPTPPATEPTPHDDLADARADLAAGRFTDVLAKSDAAPHPLTGPWLLLRADALRALDRKREAADTLVAAAGLLDGTAQAESAYSAAYLRFHDLKDADGALAALAAGDVDVPGSMFEERGLALHVQILVAQDKHAEAKPLAQRYLDRFSRGELRGLMTQEASK